MEEHIERALDLARGCGLPSPDRALDLGSGGGVPGLPLALAWPDSRWTLLDGSVTRAAFLRRAVAQLGLEDRVEVVAERAETAGHGVRRGTIDLVVSRSFGGPATTAECAAPFLRMGGILAVAEPPGGQPDRWPAAGLEQLGLSVERQIEGPTAYQLLILSAPCPDRFPRRNGVPAKRPLF